MENSSLAPKRPWYKNPGIGIMGLLLVMSTLGLASSGDTPEPETFTASVVNAPVVEQKDALFENGVSDAPASEEPAVEKVKPTIVTGPEPVPTKPIPEPKPQCHPGYSGCLNPNASDYDCAGGSGDGPYYTGPVQVYGSDPFGLDRDHDGWGCEKN